MPCWEENILKLPAEVNLDPEVWGKSKEKIFKELKDQGIVLTAFNGGYMLSNINGRYVEINQDGTVVMPEGSKPLLNAFKRAYSAAVVRHVAGSSRMKRKFNLKEQVGINSSEFLLQRRA